MGLFGDVMKQLLPLSPQRTVQSQQPSLEYEVQDLQRRVYTLERALENLLQQLDEGMDLVEVTDQPNDTLPQQFPPTSTPPVV